MTPPSPPPVGTLVECQYAGYSETYVGIVRKVIPSSSGAGRYYLLVLVFSERREMYFVWPLSTARILHEASPGA